MEKFHLISASNQPMEYQLNPPFVLLVNGEFPTDPVPLKILHSAKTIICTDGSADSLIHAGMNPQVIIGDLDSLKISKKSFEGILIHNPNQNSTDFEKTLEWIIENEIDDLNILGATGLREDHSLANLFIMADYISKLNLRMVTNYFTVTCHIGNREFDSEAGQTISLFVVKSETMVTTHNLKYTLKKTVLDPSCRAISNESHKSTFSVESDKPVLVFRSHNKL